MKQIIKSFLAASAAVALAGTAQAVSTQGLIVSDGTTTIIVPTVTSGAIFFSGSVGGWDVVLTHGLAQPPGGSGFSSSFPSLDLDITAHSQGGAGTLTVTFYSTDYGPTSGHVDTQLSGHVTSGTGGAVSFKTYYSALNTGATTTLLTSSGPISPTSGTPPGYSAGGSGGPLIGNPYSLTEVVTIDGRTLGGYSIDASVNTVPDGGTTLVLLGSALSSLALLRKRFVKA